MRILAVIAIGLALGLAGCGQKGDPGQQGAAGVQGAQGLQGVPGPAGTGIRSVQADGAVDCDAGETLVSVFCPGGGAPDGAKCGTTPTIGLWLKKP